MSPSSDDPTQNATEVSVPETGAPVPARTNLLPGLGDRPVHELETLGGTPPADAAILGDLTVPGYQILGEVGRGGMGVVFRARQMRLNRIVALKMILSGGHASATDRQRFLTEAEAIARLAHPNITQIYEIGEHAGVPFFSMEFCSGGSLSDLLHRDPPSPEKAARLVETLARAMHHAHGRGIVHRDLKPANILLQEAGNTEHTERKREDEKQESRSAGALPVPPCVSSSPYPASSGCSVVQLQPRISDFGLARKLDEQSHTQTGAVMGTPSYMAPEQARGDPHAICPATDTYALGAILYEMLTGRPPFRAASTMDTVLQVLHDDPVPPSQLDRRLSRDLETITLKCLQKEPGRRYASAEALADDLDRWLQGEPIKARPIGVVTRLWRWVRRNPAVTALLTLIGLLLLVSFLNLRASLASVQGLARRNQQLLAESLAARIDERTRSNTQAVAWLSREPEVRVLLTANAQERARVLPVVQETLKSILLANEDFSAAFVLAANGLALASTNPAHPGRSYAFRDYYRQAIAGRTYQSKVLVGTSTSRPGTYYSAPVKGQAGEVLGVVVVKLEAETLWRIVEGLDVGPNGRTMLIDEDGIVIAHRDRTRLFHSLAPLTQEQLDRLAPRVRFQTDTVEDLGLVALAGLEGKRTPGYLDYVDPDSGEKRSVAYAPLREKPWVMAIDLDTRDTRVEGIALLWRSGIELAVIGTVTGVVLLGLLLRRWRAGKA